VNKIRLGDIDVIAGLEWSAIRSPGPDGGQSVSEKKALTSFLASNKGASRGVVMSVNNYTVVGRPEKKAKVPSKVPAAAALLALANQKEAAVIPEGATEGTGEEHNWILVEQIEGSVPGYEDVNEPLFWLGMARNGLPVPGADLVLTRQRALDEISEMLASTSGATVFTTDREIRYNVVGQVAVVDKRFEDVLRGAGVDRTKAHVKLFSTAGIIAAIVLISTIVMLGGYFGWTAWSEARERDAAAAAASRNAAERKKQVAEETAKYEKEVRQALTDGLNSGMAEVNTALAAASPYETIQAWRQIIYDVSLYQSTWNLTGMNCVVDATEPSCTVSLSRGELGTNRVLLDERPDAIIEGDTASYVLRGAAIPSREIDLPYLVSSRAFSKGLISDLQVLRMTGLAHTAGASKEITKAVQLPEPSPLIPVPTLPGGPPSAAPAAAAKTVNIQLGFAKGDISIKGDAIWQVAGVSRYLDLPNTRVTALSFTTSNGLDFSWTLTADYMVRTLPAPIVPSVPVGEGKVSIEVPEKYKSKVPVDGAMEETSGTSTNVVEAAIAPPEEDKGASRPVVAPVQPPGQ
jgi:hypothetical protein